MEPVDSEVDFGAHVCVYIHDLSTELHIDINTSSTNDIVDLIGESVKEGITHALRKIAEEEGVN